MKKFLEKIPNTLLLGIGAILIFIPMYLTLVNSYKDNQQITQHFFSLPNPLTLDNFAKLFKEGITVFYGNSLLITIVSLLLIIIFVPMAAFSIARNMSKKMIFSILYGLMIIGIFIPFQVLMIPVTQQMGQMGLHNTLGLIILYITFAIPQTLFLYVGYIKLSIPVSLDEAASIDGAGKVKTYFSIMFPMMKPMHATAIILNGLWIWNDFMLPLLMLNDNDKAWTLPLFQYNFQGTYSTDFGPSFAGYFVGLVSITIVYLFFQKSIISGMSNGAVK